MGIKTYILILGLICKIVYFSYSINNFAVDTIQPNIVQQDTIVTTLLLFYTSYITENIEMNDQKVSELKKKYITSQFLDKLQKLNLDYDPFVNAQDYDEDWLKTLKVIRNKEINGVYEVYRFDNYNKRYVCIKLRIIKENGQYKIDSIVSLE